MKDLYKTDTNKILISFLSLLLILAIIVSVFGFYRDFKNTFIYGGIDLRPRVIGARLLLEGIDPYHYKWSPDDSELLLDPKDMPDKPMPRIGVTPAYLVLHLPAAKLPYKIQRIIWFFLQSLFLLLSISIFAKSTDSKTKSKLIWIIGLLFISGNTFWRLHVERGQQYILFVFLITLAFWLSKRNFKYGTIIAGFIIGFTVTLRPPIILMGIPILIYKKWKLLIGSIIGLICGIASPLILTDISIWNKYYSAMQFLGKTPHSFGSPWGESYQSIYNFKIIEGMDNLAKNANIGTDNSSLQAIFFDYLGIEITTNTLILALISILLIIVVLLLVFYKKNISVSIVFLVGITLVFIAEFFIPAARYSYYNIIWLIPLALIIINHDSIRSLLNRTIVFLFLGLFFSISIPFTPGGNLISDVFIILYIILSIVILIKNNMYNKNTISYNS